MGARERFVQTRDAVVELATIRATIEVGGEEWRPADVRKPGTSDPTAAKAIRNVDEWDAQLAELRKREAELVNIISTTQDIVRAVGEGFGEVYAMLLEHRYIDVWTWHDIHERSGITRQYGHYLIGIAFDWIDSVGISRLLKDDYEV